MLLSTEEKSHIIGEAERVEARTGVQILAVLAEKSDAYPEIPWKAFSLGTALAALALTAAALTTSRWASAAPLLWVTTMLGAGIVFALAGIFLPHVARLFLGEGRAEAEVQQFAQSLFLERGLSRTRERNAILVLASRFERRSAVVADTGIADRVFQADLDKICADLDRSMARGTASTALAQILPALENLLVQRGFSPASSKDDEVPGEFLETEGPKP